MRFIDCHMHMESQMVELDDFLARLDEAGVDGAGVFSFAPTSYDEPKSADCPVTPAQNIALLKDWMSRSDRIYGTFYINPTDMDAIEQVDQAVEAGIVAFKVICYDHYPDDPRAMKTYKHIAELGKPVMFHSGILYSPHASSKYNRPVSFEPLIEIPNLRFSLAHISWPWVDEFVSLYGHWNYMKERGWVTSELFCDTTPGTPSIYRYEALNKLYNVGYKIEDNIMLGIDCTWDYSVDYSKQIQNNDIEIFKKLGLSNEQKEKYFYKNYLRFIGKE